MAAVAEEKYLALLAEFKTYRRVAVAYSGGIDSTLLAFAACEALNPENVLMLHGASCLLSGETIEAAKRLVESDFSPRVRFRVVDFAPLQNVDVIKNESTRCYHCKRALYQRFLAVIESEHIHTLVDGTNTDDLQQERPGMQALIELDVKTPYVLVGLAKSEIRALAARRRLANADLPSNSCLATRIEQGTVLDRTQLKLIEKMENFLLDKGYSGCRVRPRGRLVILEFRSVDLARVVSVGERDEIVKYFQSHGYFEVHLDIVGRA